MYHFFNPESRFQQIMSGISDLILLNLLWIITSLPCITVGASTAALYSVLIQFDGRTPDESSVVSRYFRAFRANFRQATLILLILIVPTAILLADFLIMGSRILEFPKIWLVLSMIPGLLVVIAWSYGFPLTAIFENPTIKTIKNIFIIAFGHLPTTLAVCALNLLVPLLLFFFPGVMLWFAPVWVFIGFSLIAKCSALLLSRIFRLYVLPVSDAGDENQASAHT